MTAVARPSPTIEDRWFPQRALTRFAAGLLALSAAGVVWASRDRRQVNGEAVALKPIRFALSIGVYMLTTSAMFRYVRPERRSSLPARATVWIMVIGSTVELSCIVFQAGRARSSHFNTATRSDAAIYATMGIFAILFVGGGVPLAWEIARRPDERADRDMVRASVIGLIATVILGGVTGALMNRKGSHATGPDNRQVPLLGWTLTGRDMRPPHFLSIHAMQALPIIAAGAKRLSTRRSKPLFAGGALAYGLLTAGLLYQALRTGRAARQAETAAWSGLVLDSGDAR